MNEYLKNLDKAYDRLDKKKASLKATEETIENLQHDYLKSKGWDIEDMSYMSPKVGYYYFLDEHTELCPYNAVDYQRELDNE